MPYNDFDDEWDAMMRGQFDEVDDGSCDYETWDDEDDLTEADIEWPTEAIAFATPPSTD